MYIGIIHWWFHPFLTGMIIPQIDRIHPLIPPDRLYHIDFFFGKDRMTNPFDSWITG